MTELHYERLRDDAGTFSTIGSGGHVMTEQKPVDDLEDDTPDVPNDDATVISQPSENDDDTVEEN